MKKPQTSKVVCAAKLLLVLLFLSPIVTAQAQFTFTTNSDGSLNIAQYTGPGGAVVIPNTTNGLPITSIGDVSFFNNSTLTSVTVGTNVTTIADQAFSYSSLTDVTLPNSVTNIAFDAFLDCNDLTNIMVATNDPDFSSAAGVLFNQNETMLITFPEGKAGSYAVPNSVTNIAVYAFFGSGNLTSVALSTNVSSIANYAFYNCPALTAITVNTNNLWYSSVAGVLFDKGQDTLIAYPAGNAAASYIMPNSVTNIGMEAFYGCANLTGVTLGTNVSIVGGAAFEYCTALAGITFPDSVTVISGDAFSLCDALTNISIGTGVTNIEFQAFLGCSSLTTITVAAGNPAFSTVDGVLFNKNQTALYLYPPASSATSYAVLDSVTNIEAFAFMDSYNLTGVSLDPNLQSIGQSAFQNCFNLTNIAIPNSVTNMGTFVFYQCVSLTNVVVGSGINNIDYQVFAYCYDLRGVYFTTNAPAMNPDTFDGDTGTIAYYLPGMMDWGTTFDGIPTALWLPQIVDSGVRTNQFSFSVDWASGESVVVEGCTNLSHPVWSPLQTNMLSSNSWYFSDPQWTKYPNRFYRAISP
ncbi:MAG TPA: leucine-rich repeat domain-containing protein [Candidatus Sulfotelmatobacter sp.]|nr:leucine-rich repeat domain-containing protein [Candidatus Sulfotelmatobacter sp.]